LSVLIVYMGSRARRLSVLSMAKLSIRETTHYLWPRSAKPGPGKRRCMLWLSVPDPLTKDSHDDKMLINGVSQDGYHVREWIENGSIR